MVRKRPIERKGTKFERQLCFGKRHLGLVKKVYELAVLCDVDVGLIMYSPIGVLRHFSTKSPNAAKLLQGLVLENMSEEERAQLQLSQDIINMINRTAAQDDVADQPGLDTARREVIERKNRELKLLQETKRMVCPAMETLYSSSEREKLERCLETRLSAIVELKRQITVQQVRHQQGVQALGMRNPSSSSVQVHHQQGVQALGMRDPSSSSVQVQHHQQGVQALGMRYPSSFSVEVHHQQGVQALGTRYPSSSSVQVQQQAGRNWDPPHRGGRQLQRQQVLSAGGMGCASAHSSSMQIQSEEEASLEADVEMHEAIQQALFHPSVDSFDGSII